MKNLKYSSSLEERVSKNLFDWIKQIEGRGAGEIFLISIDNDGTEKKINFELLERLRYCSKLPMLYGGGIFNEAQINKIENIEFDGVVISNALHQNKINFIKKYL